jgi:hypothetical protein
MTSNLLFFLLSNRPPPKKAHLKQCVDVADPVLLNHNVLSEKAMDLLLVRKNSLSVKRIRDTLVLEEMVGISLFHGLEIPPLGIALIEFHINVQL